MPQPGATVTVHAAHSIVTRPTVWYSRPDTLEEHAFQGFRSMCRRFTWQASWGIVGELESVTRSRACTDCLALTADPAPGEIAEAYGS